MSIAARISGLAALSAAVLLAVAGLFAQEDAPKAKAKKPPTSPPAAAPKADAADAAPPADPNKPASAEYQRLFEEWKTLLKGLRKLKVDYQTADDATQKTILEQWDALVAKGNEIVDQLREAGIKAYEESPNEDPQLARFLVKLAADHIAHDQYEAANAIAQPMVQNESPEKEIYDTAGAAAFVLNDYEKAGEYFKAAQQAGVLSKFSEDLAPQVADYKKLWAEEEKIRAAEAAADDLPRVKLTTTKGEIVLELFENEAPETVGNFISLVEKKDDDGKGFYEGVPFHRVLANFMAQGGDPTGTGEGGPGYSIYCECYKPDYRKHFAGSLSMAHAGRDTGGSQFFLTFRPTPNLNGKHTCFGRVIEGMDVLAKLQRINPEEPSDVEPDKIVKAEVLRKREHAYAPRKVE
jgi:cyclophilin family peptidyl-prolyl cis-trans isomerase